jgi:hypothetical protein
MEAETHNRETDIEKRIGRELCDPIEHADAKPRVRTRPKQNADEYDGSHRDAGDGRTSALAMRGDQPRGENQRQDRLFDRHGGTEVCKSRPTHTDLVGTTAPPRV